MNPALQTKPTSYSWQLCFILSLLITIPVTSLLPVTVAAQGNLLVTPRRIVFEGTQKIQELNLANTGRDTATYLISFIEIRMKEDGNFELINQPDSGQYFASNCLRFFPRSVTLAPNEAQIVKVQLTKTSQLEPGEYRSHFYFRAVPAEKPLGTPSTANDTSGISIQLIPVFGISIPVIVRRGETNANVNISDLELITDEDMQPRLNMILHRTGNKSVYGDLKVVFISPQGKSIPVSEINGIAVYTPTPSRKISMPLQKVPGIDYKTGKLQVVYTTPSDAKSIKIAAAELVPSK